MASSSNSQHKNMWPNVDLAPGTLCPCHRKLTGRVVLDVNFAARRFRCDNGESFYRQVGSSSWHTFDDLDYFKNLNRLKEESVPEEWGEVAP